MIEYQDIPIYEEHGSFDIELQGATYTLPKRCPHRHGWLEYGYINEKNMTITCPLHFSTFSLKTGEQISGPKCSNLRIRISS